MRRQDFYYHLPEELIAHHPSDERTGSRLLYLNGVTGERQHQQFPDLLQYLRAGDVMVLNNTKVIPARLFGQKTTGGSVEILLERLLDEHRFLAHVRASKAPKSGAKLQVEDVELVVNGRHDALFEISTDHPALAIFESHGHMPLPPYIDREDTEEDQSRYQTVYGEHHGAVAAPTAGLHFDRFLLDAIQAKGVEIQYVTLHVGAGTFQPVRADAIENHTMHSEWMAVSSEVCQSITEAKAEGRRVIAVGTTSMRSLETMAQYAVSDQKGVMRYQAYQGDTDIFIYPGYEFKVVDALVTNFHLSESTLLMLVSAFAGYRNIMMTYREAIEQGYRFFSYGDAMLLIHNPNAPQETVDRAEVI